MDTETKAFQQPECRVSLENCLRPRILIMGFEVRSKASTTYVKEGIAQPAARQ